jgi:hypothetical protein
MNPNPMPHQSQQEQIPPAEKTALPLYDVIVLQPYSSLWSAIVTARHPIH